MSHTEVRQIKTRAERIPSWRVLAVPDGNATEARFGQGIVMRHLEVQRPAPPMSSLG
jgi:hypothetical protein